MGKETDDQYSDEEADRRFKEAIRRAVTTPHKPQQELAGKTPGARGEAQRRRRAKSRPKS
jgi:hypothetical protein